MLDQPSIIHLRKNQLKIADGFGSVMPSEHLAGWFIHLCPKCRTAQALDFLGILMYGLIDLIDQ
jgi:hypothetical protein